MGTPPRYGQRSLAEVVPALLAGLGVRGMVNQLDVPELSSVCLLLVDGLGSELLERYAAAAPFLASLAAGTSPIDAGFPATTATSIASLAMGMPPGRHGIVGYSFAPGNELAGGPEDTLLNALSWRSHGTGKKSVDLTEIFVPEQLQAQPTALELARHAGIEVTAAAPKVQQHSGLTRAVLRGASFRGTYALGDLAATALATLSAGQRAFCYAYHGDLDLMGHLYGPGSPAWRLQLAHVDRLAATIAAALPAGSALAVVADHGMVELDEPVDADLHPELLAGVRLLGGEVRARHVYVRPGAQAEVCATWSEVLGTRAYVRPREEAVAAGWFGPEVSDGVLRRIGDVVVAARGQCGVIRSIAEPMEARLRGHHGSLSSAEQHVPFLLALG